MILLNLLIIIDIACTFANHYTTVALEASTLTITPPMRLPLFYLLFNLEISALSTCTSTLSSRMMSCCRCTSRQRSDRSAFIFVILFLYPTKESGTILIQIPLNEVMSVKK